MNIQTCPVPSSSVGSVDLPTQVLRIAHELGHDLGALGESDVREGPLAGRSNVQRENSQRRAFLRELDAMIRLRSPHTVNVYGAVTSLPDRMVLVMELLAGGDLRTLLRNSEQRPLPEEQSRRIIGDICAGMTFLHSKDTVHGDLKSANVLLDGAGRAKVGDDIRMQISPCTCTIIQLWVTKVYSRIRGVP